VEPGASGTNLLWLITHMADAEESWMVRRFAGIATDVVEEPPGASPDGALATAVGRYRATWAVVDALVAGASGPEAPCAGDDVRPPCPCAGSSPTSWRRRPATPGTPTSSAS